MKVEDPKTCKGEIMTYYLNQEELEALKRWATCAKTHVASRKMGNVAKLQINLMLLTFIGLSVNYN